MVLQNETRRFGVRSPPRIPQGQGLQALAFRVYRDCCSISRLTNQISEGMDWNAGRPSNDHSLHDQL